MTLRPPASWKELLSHPGPAAHIAQLYRDDEFCGEAIAHFAGSGLQDGEAVILIATQQRSDRVALRLAQRGFDVARLTLSGQLAFLEAGNGLSKFMTGTLPDARAFKAWIEQVLERAWARKNVSGIRLWGEMVNLLYLAGNRRGCYRLEELFDETAREHSIVVLCSLLMDKYDPRIYEADFQSVCHSHSHLIPAEDDASQKHAVNRAVREVIGEIKGPLFRSLALWGGAPCVMPSAQALLLWIRDTLPTQFHEVVARARAYESEVRGYS